MNDGGTSAKRGLYMLPTRLKPYIGSIWSFRHTLIEYGSDFLESKERGGPAHGRIVDEF
jgi:hypothetical protein